MPPSAGSWDMPREVLQPLPGYRPDVQKNRAETRDIIMKKHGDGPDRRLAITATTRNTPAYRDPAVLLIDQLKEVFIAVTPNAINPARWYPAVMCKDCAVGLTVRENGLDDPHQQFHDNFVCGAECNCAGYRNPAVEKRVEQQSKPADTQKRCEIAWQIERGRA